MQEAIGRQIGDGFDRRVRQGGDIEPVDETGRVKPFDPNL
jgi:hypothetical protein